MRLSKVLLFVISLVLVVGTTQAKVIHGGKVAGDTVLVIQKTSIAPVLSRGKISPIWDLVDATPMEYALGTHKLADWSDCSAWVKLMYDDNNIYGLYYVQDDVIDSTINGQSYQWDGCEFFIDANNTHATGSSLVLPAHQYNLHLPNNIIADEAAEGHGLQYTWFIDTAAINGSKGPSGYFVQFQFPLDSLGFTTPVAGGTKASIQFQIDDNDLTSDLEVHVLNWWNSRGNTDWYETLHWGNAVFSSDPAIDTKYVFLKTSTAPVVDGDKDAIYDKANQLTSRYIYSGGILTNANPSDLSWRFYGLYDDHKIYGFFTVYDDVVDYTINGQSYQWDGVEFFVDANNTHATGSSLALPAHQYNLHLPNVIADDEAAEGHGLQYDWKVTNPAVAPNDSVFSSIPGYTVEFSFPLDSLGFTSPVILGTVFSMQLQVDDNDLTAALEVHTSNWWNSAGNVDWYETLQWGDAKFGSAIVTGVKGNPGQTIRSFELAQNYPNPFNPSTEISFTLAKSEKVKLAVYNLLGKEVAVLVNGTRNAGAQTVTFDAKNLSSGVYFYKLETGSTVLAKKMMLIK
ncbi:MAG: sugar-binding protein [Bacteroidota bacterium]